MKSKPEHAVIRGTFFAIGLTGFLAEMFRIAVDGRPDFEKWSFIGYPLSGLVENLDAVQGWHPAMWIDNGVSLLVFLVLMPVTMMRPMVHYPLNLYLPLRERPQGCMKAMLNHMATHR